MKKSTIIIAMMIIHLGSVTVVYTKSSWLIFQVHPTDSPISPPVHHDPCISSRDFDSYGRVADNAVLKGLKVLNDPKRSQTGESEPREGTGERTTVGRAAAGSEDRRTWLQLRAVRRSGFGSRKL